jgi:hypothetical protein
MKESNAAFLLTMVYGPVRNGNKTVFLRKLQDLKPQLGTPWLILGDFNCIYKARDKNNNCLNLWLMNQFRQVIDECDSKNYTYRIGNSLGAMKGDAQRWSGLIEYFLQW